jgi:nucleoside-diphosphate-sugar epimerase
MINVLITGANSYIGMSFAAWLSKWPDKYHVDTISMRCNEWRSKSFAGYDAVFHVAGIAHRTTSKSMTEQYFAVNRDLAVWTATKAKTEGVKQFVFMSSMMVYGLGKRGEEQVITI